MLQLLNIGINPTKFSRISKDLKKRKKLVSVISISALGKPERRLADILSFRAVSPKKCL